MTDNNSPNASPRQFDNLIMPRDKRDHEKPLHWARTAESMCENPRASAIVSLFVGTAAAILVTPAQMTSDQMGRIPFGVMLGFIATSAMLCPVRKTLAPVFGNIAQKAEEATGLYRTRALERDRPENQ